MCPKYMAEKKDADQTGERATEVREHLANERTLLSWVRTGVGLISLGIVVERAGALVSQTIPGGISELLGLALALLGRVTLVLGTQQFLRNRRLIMRGEFFPSVGVYLVVVAGGLALGAALLSTCSSSRGEDTQRLRELRPSAAHYSPNLLERSVLTSTPTPLWWLALPQRAYTFQWLPI
jgi:putative membrane protein